MMFTKKNTPPKLQRTLDGVRKEKDSFLLTNPDGPPRRGLLAVTTALKSFFLPSLRVPPKAGRGNPVRSVFASVAKQSRNSDGPLRKSLAQTEKMDRHVVDSSRNRKMRHCEEASSTTWLSKILSQKRIVGGGIATLILVAGVSMYFSEEIKGATYGWTQSSWIGGVTANTATHTNNQENWTEYASKDANIQADASGVTITGTNNSWVETSDSNFTTGTNTGVYVSGTGTNADVKLLKPFGATCSTNTECFDGNVGNAGSWCNSGVCTNPWLSGSCAGIYIYYKDSSTGSWKTTNTNCNTPQCGLDGGQNNDNLVADNSVDFSLYPARNVCKNIGGRLPTLSELQCIYTNRAVYDDYGAFTSNDYWSSTEYSETNAYYVHFLYGGTVSNFKTSSLYVRCVRGQ